MKIIVDVDDVVFDLVPMWLSVYNLTWEDTLVPEQITDWDMTKFVKPECGKKVYDILKASTLYMAGRAVPGAYDGVRELKRLGHTIQFVTAGDNYGKRWWMAHRGFLAFGSYHVHPQKWTLPADLIIDDNGDTVSKFPGIKVLFDRPWNLKYDLPRVRDWDEVVGVVRVLGG